jgi:hypothetical protein
VIVKVQCLLTNEKQCGMRRTNQLIGKSSRILCMSVLFSRWPQSAARNFRATNKLHSYTQRTRFTPNVMTSVLVPSKHWSINLCSSFTSASFPFVVLMSYFLSFRSSLTTEESGVRFPIGTWEFSVLPNVQTDSEAHRASYMVGIAWLYSWVKAVGAWIWALASIYSRG